VGRLGAAGRRLKALAEAREVRDGAPPARETAPLASPRSASMIRPMEISAEDIMTEEVTTVFEGSSLGAALEIMQEQEIRHLPVIRGQRLVGMLSDRDVRAIGLRRVVDMESLDRLESRMTATVASVMTTNVWTVTRISGVVEIIDILIEERVGAVPVVHGGELVGIVSYVDVLRAMRECLD